MPLSDQNIIFITGASRSGTTLLSFILRNHSKVFGLKELHYFGESWDPRKPDQKMNERQMVSAVANIYKCQEQGVLAAKNTHRYCERAQALINSLDKINREPANLFMAAVSELCEAEGKSIPCEQTPRNIFYADELLRTYPDAKVIHIIRDPRAVMASQKYRWKRRSLATDKKGVSRYQSVRVWVNYHPFTVARMWLKATQQAMRLVSHPRFTLVRFEDLIQEPEKTVLFLCDRLGLQFESLMLEVGQINSSHQSSIGGARKGLQTDSIDKWRKILSPREIAAANRLCHDLMAEHSYDQPMQKNENSHNELFNYLTYPFHLAGVFVINPRRALVQTRALLGRGRKNKKAIDQPKSDIEDNKSTNARKA